MAKSLAPKHVRIRMYQVGFGDCFLLSFVYAAPTKTRHLLIDFGTTGQPVGEKKLLDRVAANVAEVVGKEPFAVVATHRHADHIAGFDPGKNGAGSGSVIAGLKPRFVVQPWTEDPKAKTDANAPPGKQAMAARRLTLEALHGIAEQVVLQSVPRLRRAHATRSLAGELGFLGEDNLKNPGAVKQLMSMAPNDYVYAGKATRLSSFLPGVGVRVLGPPTVVQEEGVKRQRQRDPDEFWTLRARSFHLEADPLKGRKGHETLFPANAGKPGRHAPEWARWLIRRQRVEHAEGTLQLVRQLDKAMNNTSVILLFSCGKQRLLFPGDAQIENWRYALGKADWMKELGDVTMYKVGHHGSLNATPMSLWRTWFPKGTKAPAAAQRMLAMMSTMEGKHGHEEDGTEVPRKRLVSSLKSHTRLRSTENLHGDLFTEEILSF
jgi:hypothetical protein